MVSLWISHFSATTTNLESAFFSNDANKILAGCVVALAIALVFAVRYILKLIDKINTLQDEWRKDSNASRDKQVELSDQAVRLTERFHEQPIGKRGK
jgi:hypothetical protein